MTISSIDKGDTVTLAVNYLEDEGETFRAGDTGEVVMWDNCMAVVRMLGRSGYRICVQPTLLNVVCKDSLIKG